MAQLHAEQVFAYFYDVSGAHGDQKIAGGDVFQQIVFDFIEGFKIFAGGSLLNDFFL